jgi:hypothetical protein
MTRESADHPKQFKLGAPLAEPPAPLAEPPAPASPTRKLASTSSDPMPAAPVTSISSIGASADELPRGGGIGTLCIVSVEVDEGVG